MKLSKTALMTFVLLCCCVMDGDADPIYTWVDSKGVTHITQEPPPQTAKSIDVMNYPAQPEPTTPQPAAANIANQQQGNLNKGGVQPEVNPAPATHPGTRKKRLGMITPVALTGRR